MLLHIFMFTFYILICFKTNQVDTQCHSLISLYLQTVIMFRQNCNKEAFLCSSWIQQLLLVWIFPFFLSVQDALIPAQFDMSNCHHHSLYTGRCQPDWFIGLAQSVKRVGEGGREEETEMRNEPEMEAVQTVGPPGIYDACRQTINANISNPAIASRTILGKYFFLDY